MEHDIFKIREAVTLKLRQLNVNEANKPFVYLREAVVQHMLNPGAIYGSWCKQVLPAVAQNCGGVAISVVENSLARVCSDAWYADDGKTVRKVLGQGIGGTKPPKVRMMVIWIANSISL